MNKHRLEQIQVLVSRRLVWSPAFRKALESCVMDLDGQEYDAILLRFGLLKSKNVKDSPMSYADVGRRLTPKVTGGRASQVVRKAIRKLQYQARVSAGKLRPFMKPFEDD